eukprot:CAMPEP_0183299030 /NCGR_PEP_ID=MMETSP0160_2-20130417/5869_1 /TAXON_ID=2839 ORGANISM="Odontella Sinensis, Strain Grunow 1884" /NCGR_SAMPLE_ID=MMETSP0160_2 /ASSEMBLY_ACC=CAM_ASM_000250 /LENGTH=96 /DNA_ID=CAMNT_0025461179 /DNA_START=468 /DNA_END=754 /DNA_ORIENTATION=-
MILASRAPPPQRRWDWAPNTSPNISDPPSGTPLWAGLRGHSTTAYGATSTTRRLPFVTRDATSLALTPHPQLHPHANPAPKGPASHTGVAHDPPNR